MIEKNVPTTAKKDCPIIVCRIVRSVSRWFSSRYRPISCRWRPNDFARRIPDTESVSSVIAVRSASVCCVLLATFRRARPTLTVSHTKIGVMQSDRIVSCTEISSIAINELAMMTTFDSRLAAVEVTTDCTPPTSFARRDWISPVRVVVKNRSGMYCRCL